MPGQWSSMASSDIKDSAMKRLLKNILIVMLVAVPLAHADNSINLASQVQGVLGVSNGGTGSTTYNPYNPAAVAITGGTISANLTAPNGIRITGGNQSPGWINVNSLSGLELGAITGSIYDFQITNASNTIAAMAMPTGTANMQFGADVIALGKFTGAGTGLTGTAPSLNIGGNAATATTATNQSGGTVSATTATASTSYSLNGKLLASATAPTISAGCGTSPSIQSNGTSVIALHVGTGGTATSCTLTFPTPTTGWVCSVGNSVNGPNLITSASLSTATTVVVTNTALSTNTPTAWSSGWTVYMNCQAY